MQQQQQQQQQYMQLQHQQQLQQQLQQQQQQQQQMAHLHSLYSPQSLYPPTATVSLPATAAATMSAGQPMVAPSQMLPYWPAAHVSAGPTSAFPSTAPGGVMMIATPPPPAQLTGMSMGGLQPMAFGQVAVGSVQSQQLQGNPGQAVAAQPTSAAQKQQQQLQQQQQQQQQLQKQQQADSERQQRLRPCTPPAVPAAMDSAKALAAAPGGARVAPERTESPASCLSPMYSAVSGARLSGLSGSKSFRGPEDSSTLLLAPVARRPKLLHAPTSASPQFVSPNLQVRPDLAVGSCSVPGARAGSESLESHATVEAPELGAPASFPTPSAAGSPYLSLCSHGSQAGKLHEQQSSMLYSVHQSAHSQQSSPGALLQLLS
ncbi:hypothetical protein CLOP_g21557 [Closterium sp. NIES-67]|nr:hypothetical protein CLOP_g21557 [Closterium sp. NIES-67]